MLTSSLVTLMASRDRILRTLRLDEVVFPGLLLLSEVSGQEFQGGPGKHKGANRAELPGHRGKGSDELPKWVFSNPAQP